MPKHIEQDTTVAYTGVANLRMRRTDADKEFGAGHLCCSENAVIYTFKDTPVPLRVSAMVRSEANIPMQIAIVCMNEDRQWMGGGQLD